MIAVLSPSKTLDPTPRPQISGTTTPDFLDEASVLISRLRKLSQSDLASLMSISEKLAAENHKRFLEWNTPFTPENAAPAMLMFRGDVYEGLEADSFDAKDRNFAQKQLRILSGLYGLLRPLDLMQPYRLEMGTTFLKGSPQTLYEFWGDQVTDALNASFANQKKPTLINLASNEYFRAVNPDALCARIIAPSFKEEQGGKLRMVTYFAKKARGSMARYIIVNRLKNPDDLLDFDLDGYRYNESASTEDIPVFSRTAS